MTEARARPAGRGRPLGAAIVGVVILLGAAFVAGRLLVPPSGAPVEGSAAAGFLRDMQLHHAQAVELAMTVRDRSDDPAIRLLAYDIATFQANQAGQMYGMLEAWGLPQTAGEPSMAWMAAPPLDDADDHGHGGDPVHEPGAPMPGMASQAELDELAAAEGVEAERLFLRLMIDHHEGGVEMALAVLARDDTPAVVSLAFGIVRGQESEIEYMTGLLDGRDAEPATG